jgi:phenylpropionate dioxygenase-like ring-hydroxylating dioxygenase large terminal subunit
MLTKRQSELLTRTGRGTPMGDLLRQYWQPAALSEELPPGGAPLPIQLLGEELVLFRGEDGQPGLLGLRCPHRGTDLSYGRIESRGLRCIYHGWLFDAAGNCLEQPAEPPGSRFKRKVRHLAYPCREVAGIIFAYLGPGEPPLFPAYEIFSAPEAYRFNPIKGLHECNYLQASEGNLDPSHLGFLHQMHEATPSSAYSGSFSAQLSLIDPNAPPTLDVEETDFGLRIYAVRPAGPEHRYVRITNFVMPNLCAIAGVTGQDGYQMDWHVPIDDAHHWKYTLAFTRSEPPPDPGWSHVRAEMAAGYRFIRNRANRYLQDRASMTTWSFSGLGPVFQVHDVVAVEAQGPIQDRTAERLGYGDKAIARARQMLLRAIRTVQEGRDPPHVVRDPRANDFAHLVVRSEVVPSALDYRTYWQQSSPLPQPVGGAP